MPFIPAQPKPDKKAVRKQWLEDDDVRPGFVGQYELAAGIEGAVPRVVGVARGVGGGAVAAVAEREDHPHRPDDVEGAVEHVVSGRADHPPVLFEELRDHHVVEHVRAH